jgi:hypothetical protein
MPSIKQKTKPPAPFKKKKSIAVGFLSSAHVYLAPVTIGAIHVLHDIAVSLSDFVNSIPYAHIMQV